MLTSKLLAIAPFFLLASLAITVPSLVFNREVSANVQENEEERLPGGTWRVGTTSDRRQFNDPSVPVEIARISSSVDKGKDNGLEEVIILNRTAKVIKGIKLTYTVTAQEDLENVLTGGPLDIISKKPVDKQKIPGHQRRIFKVLNGKPARMFKPLKKDGNLSGVFIITIRISEVTFEDGSTWTDKGAVISRETLKRNHGLTFRKVSIRSPPTSADECPNMMCFQQVINGQLTGFQLCLSAPNNGTYCDTFNGSCNLFNCVNGQIPDLAGERDKVISDTMGHVKINFNRDVYQKVLPVMKEHASDNLERLLFSGARTMFAQSNPERVM